MPDDTFSLMRDSIIAGAPDTASDLAQQAIAAGTAPLDAINNGYVPGMHDVGEQFARGQMFLPDMMASAEAMRAAMAVLDPELKKLGSDRPRAGIVVLGTTKGDIHEIAKILVGTLLTAHGFQVHDLGADVSGEKFAAKAQELSRHSRGFSAPDDDDAESEDGDRSAGALRHSCSSQSDGRRRPRNAPLGRRDRRRWLRERCNERGSARPGPDATEADIVENLQSQ